MKVYIAGPMTGYEDYNYPAFEAAREQLAASGLDVLSPTDIDTLQGTVTGSQTWDWYMRHALTMVLDADAVALLDGWERSKGACLERDVARALGLQVKPLAYWIGDKP